VNFQVTETQLVNHQIIKSDIPKCIVLAAGTSTRLRPLTDTIPKCLLKVSGKTLLERTIENVFAAGIKEIAVVVGYRAEMIRDFVKRLFPQQRIRFIFNPNYARTNNAYSLLLAYRFLEDKNAKMVHNVLLLDSDILFSNKLLPHFLSAESKNKIAVRISGEHNEEEIQVGINSYGNINFIGKRPAFDKAPGESIGIELFSAEVAAKLFVVLGRRVWNGMGRTEFYEAAFQEMIDEGVILKAVDVSAFPAIEIDTPEDLALAGQLTIDA
jgi:choline kinase